MFYSPNVYTALMGPKLVLSKMVGKRESHSLQGFRLVRRGHRAPYLALCKHAGNQNPYKTRTIQKANSY